MTRHDPGQPASGGYRAARIWLSRLAIPLSAPPLFSRLATAQSRSPSSEPGTAVMFRWTWLRVTTRPSRSRLSGPRTRLRTLHAAAAGAAAAAARLVWTGSVAVWETLPRDEPLASVSVPFSAPVASSTPFTTLNEVGVNVPLKVPFPSALVNVPVTADVMLFAAAAVVTRAAEPAEVAAEALVAMIAGTPIPIDKVSADAVIRRALESLMWSSPALSPWLTTWGVS